MAPRAREECGEFFVAARQSEFRCAKFVFYAENSELCKVVSAKGVQKAQF